jgi:hypothetical protein
MEIHGDMFSPFIFVSTDIAAIFKRCSLDVYFGDEYVLLAVECQIGSDLHREARPIGWCPAAHDSEH